MTEDLHVTLMKEIETGNVTVGVVGLGYVGLPLAVAFAREGIDTIGLDTNKKKLLCYNGAALILGILVMRN